MSETTDARVLIAKLQVAVGQLVCGETATSLMRDAASALESALARETALREQLGAALNMLRRHGLLNDVPS
jgi:hypothetical protein